MVTGSWSGRPLPAPTPPTDRPDRWQVLTVRRGRVVYIRGYEERPAALARARVPKA